MLFVPESNTRVLGLKNGDYDAISTVGFNQAKSLEAGGDLVLEAQPIFRLDYVYLNHSKKPLDNKKIRLALNYAANREAILKAVYFGFGELPNSYMPVVNFHSKSVPLLPYDINKAKQLVQEAGYDGTPIKLMVIPAMHRSIRSPRSCSRAGVKPASRRKSSNSMSAPPSI
jgi:peptide/nickel transport system substrate-binding protein